MSTSRARRRRSPALVAVVLSLGLVAGCGTGQKQADSYEALEDGFMQGCEATAASDAKEDASKALPKDFCKCAFAKLSDEQTGYDFDELMEINEEFTSDPARLPDEVVKVFADCKEPA